MTYIASYEDADVVPVSYESADDVPASYEDTTVIDVASYEEIKSI